MNKKAGTHSFIILFLLYSIFFCILAGILFAGLWPFRILPKNRVYFDSHSRYLLFKKPSMAIINDFPQNLNTSQGFTIELKLKSRIRHSGNVPRILSLTSGKEERLIIGQWKSGIIFRCIDNHLGEIREIGYSKAFSAIEPILVTFSSCRSGSVIYINGKAMRRSKKPVLHHLSTLEGVAVIANSASGDQPWSGEFYHLSIFNRSLSSHEILKRSQNPPMGQTEGEVVHLNFSQNPQSNTIGNNSSPKSQLFIPKRFSPPEKKMLTPPWIDLAFNKRYLLDVILNFFGFIPLGIVSGLLMRLNGVRFSRAILLSLFISAIVSLTIEILQAYLPSRTSQLSDLILNSAGGGIGAGVVYFLESVVLTFRRP